MATTDRPTESEIKRLKKNLLVDKGPSSRQQSYNFVFWRQLGNHLGQPFDATRIPLSKLHQMRRDPMLAFGLHYIKIPLLRAQWAIESDDAQISAFADQALRKIYARFVLQYLNCLDFGYAGIVKRFEQAPVLGTYIDPSDADQKEKPIWSEGSVDPIVWRTFVGLPPEQIEPLWTQDGEFDGLRYDVKKDVPLAFPVIGREDLEDGRKVPLDLSLWVTNERDSVFNSPWGYPRTGYAFRIWWSYWYRWALADRHFEKDADPPAIVRYPDDPLNQVLDDDGQPIDFRSIALSIGEQARSGSTIAMPSNVIESEFDGRPTAVPNWDLTFVKGGANFDVFDKTFTALDVMKLRAIFIPENALIEGGGGCLSPDTPIICPRDHALYPDGVPLSKIDPGQLVWCFDTEENKFVLRPVKNVYKTMEAAELYKLTLDDGTEILGTPDHPFMSRDGVWREMIDLKPGDRLMPLYESARENSYSGNKLPENDFEPMILLDPDFGRFEFEYRIIGSLFGWTGNGKKLNIHHVDGFHSNTSLENLEGLTPFEHASRHFEDEEFRIKHAEAVQEAMDNLPEETKSRMRRDHWNDTRRKAYAEKQAIAGLESITKFRESLSPEEYKSWCSTRAAAARASREANSVLKPKKIRECRRCKNEFQPISGNSWYCTGCVEIKRQPYLGRIENDFTIKVKSCDKCAKEFETQGNSKICYDCSVSVINHRVASVEKLDRTGEVWDIEIDGPENVKNFVAGGVVVHNTSSRNVAATMTDTLQESQAAIMAEIDDYINQYMLPQLIKVNFPEYKGTVRKVSKGFGSEDVELAKAIIQFVGQADPDKLGVDTRIMLEGFGIPLKSPQVLEAEREKAIAEAQAMQPPADQVTVAGTTAGTTTIADPRTDTGFSVKYVQPGDSIFLAEDINLPNSKMYKDKTILSLTKQHKAIWESQFSEIYDKFADYVGSGIFSEEDTDSLELAQDNNDPDERAKFLVDRFALSFGIARNRSLELIKKIMRQGAKNELRSSKLSLDWDFDNSAAAQWAEQHAATLVQGVAETTRRELRKFVAEGIRDNLSNQEIANNIREHFSEFPGWKSERVARTETMLAYNFSTLFAGEDAGIKRVQALDARGGPTDEQCERRNGKIFDISEAFNQTAQTHPNDTLSWRLLKGTDLSVDYIPRDQIEDDKLAWFDAESDTIFMAEDIEEEDKEKYLLMIGDKLV